jgi:KDO2-lipid IV(A) lauroyltransferase
MAWLPFGARMLCGNLLGRLTWLIARERRYITAVNIGLCFPALDPGERSALVMESFIENSRGLIETACGWIRPPAHFRTLVTIRGSEYMDAALAQGKGVLLLGAHYSTLDFCANLLSLHYPFAVTYRAHKNPLFDAFMLRGRLGNCNGVFERNDIRGAFRHLRQGKALWYAPDQDYGPEQAVYAPFFGNRAATITAASRFAAFNDSPVLFVSHHRITSNRNYILEFMPPPERFPSGDDVLDATNINRVLERTIRVAPAQYLWMHKRFKTQPGGKPESPYIMIKTPDRKLSEDQYALLTTGAVALSGHRMQLQNGLQLRIFPGLSSGILSRHPAIVLDETSKQLRSLQIPTITVDSIFRFPSRHTTGVTCHVPAMKDSTSDNRGTEPLAGLLYRLHESGFSFADPTQAELLLSDKGLAVGNPLALTQHRLATPTSARIADLQHFGRNNLQALADAYLHLCNEKTCGVLRIRLALPDTLADNAPSDSRHEGS